MPFEGVLVEAYKGTRRKHNMKFRQIGHTTSQYGQLFLYTISAWIGLAFAEVPYTSFMLNDQSTDSVVLKAKLQQQMYT